MGITNSNLSNPKSDLSIINNNILNGTSNLLNTPTFLNSVSNLLDTPIKNL